MRTADDEKIQLQRHEIRTTDAGEEEVRGIAKNISEVKTDAALVATFLDSKKGNIGTRVVILRDIEPNTIRQFDFKFKPQEGDIVGTYTLNIGDIVEQQCTDYTIFIEQWLEDRRSLQATKIYLLLQENWDVTNCY